MSIARWPASGKEPVQPDKPQPAVPVKKSVFPDYIVCLEDGKKLKMLKRHLKTAYNMTPEQYRERWGLAADYPMVAPNYAEHRSTLAKKIGLGTKPRGPRASADGRARQVRPDAIAAARTGAGKAPAGHSDPRALDSADRPSRRAAPACPGGASARQRTGLGTPVGCIRPRHLGIGWKAASNACASNGASR